MDMRDGGGWERDDRQNGMARREHTCYTRDENIQPAARGVVRGQMLAVIRSGGPSSG